MIEDPNRRPIGDDDYYGANAKLLYYRDILNNSLKGKNPKGFDQFLSSVGEIRRKDPSKSQEFIEGYDFKEALSPQDLKDILKDDYSDYVDTIRTIRDRGYADNKAKKLYGEKEMEQEVENLMYGKRFATMPVVTSAARTTKSDKGDMTIEDMFTYDPKMKKVNKITVRK
jgi:hypothetical protein